MAAATAQVPAALKKFDAAAFLADHAPNVTEDSVILGIDEAGRGPAIGDMVYAAAMVRLGDHARLVACGVADSKTLDERARNACRTKLEALADATVSEAPQTGFRALVLPVSPEAISEAMFGRSSGRTLNTLSHEAAIALIKRATLMCRGALAAVFVDTVGPPATYERLLKGRFPHLIVKVSKKADSIFPVVSAASIFAKTDRDAGIARAYPRGDVGSGYPSDERTRAFLNRSGLLNRFFSFTSNDVRQSWAPVVKITTARCVECTFEADEERQKRNDSAGGVVSAAAATATAVMMRQPAFTFARQPPKRDPVFSTLLGLQTVMAL